MTTDLAQTAPAAAMAQDWELLRKVEQFLYLEARLADENRYDEWLSLWADDDVLYWAPLSNDDADPKSHLSLIYDNRALLEERVYRLAHTPAHAQSPPSRLHRAVSNVVLEEHHAEQGIVQVTSVFMIFEVRRGVGTLYSGRAGHRLRIGPTGFQIDSKKVVLTLNEEPLGNLTFLL
ncbi:MAG: aromatic-ring-hydroxylating dioxygenase subunit beta [Micromonosporaceae bacterium]